MSFVGQLGFWPDPLLAGCIELVGPDDLLGVWPLYGPQLVINASVIGSPDTFDANPPWTPIRLTPQADHHTVLETVDNNTHYLQQALAIATGPRSFSLDIEPYGRDWTMISAEQTILSRAWFHLTGAGAVGTASNVNASIQELTSEGHPGRYRCAMEPTAAGDFGPAPNLRVFTSIANGSSSHPGDVTKGLKLYNAQIDQTSIVTAPNLYGVQALARYGDRFDLTNPTKSSQPVLEATGWNGLPCGRFSAANYLYADAVAAQLAGDDTPWSAVAAATTDTVAAGTAALICLGHATIPDPLHIWWRSGANAVTYRRPTVGVAAQPTHATGWTANARVVHAESFSGTTVSAYRDAIPDASNPMALDVGSLSADRFTLGMQRYQSGLLAPWSGTARYLVVAKSAQSDAVMQALSRLVQAYCPV